MPLSVAERIKLLVIFLLCCCSNINVPATFGEDIEVPEELPVAVLLALLVEVNPVPFPVISGFILKSSVGP